MTFFLVPFEIADACTVSLLECYSLLHQRKVVLPELIQYSLRHADWGLFGMIQLKKVSETVCEVVYFDPPAVINTDAMAFLAYVQEKLWGQKQYSMDGEASHPPKTKLNIWDLYPDFPDVGLEMAHLLNTGEEAGKVWDRLMTMTQGYITMKRAKLMGMITVQHTNELVQRQQLSLLEGAKEAPVPEAAPLQEAAPLFEADCRVRTGPKPTESKVKEQIIAEWEKVKGRMNQEAFCRSKGIGVSTLHSWMQKKRQNRS